MKRFAPLLFIFICAIPLILPFFRSGYFTTHDGEWAIIRLAEMNRELADFQIPPRWSGFLNHGYGYPLFLFTYPFPYYAAEIFHVLGLGFVTSIKAVFVLSIVGSAVAMFFLGKYWWGVWGGVVASIFYLYAPFRITDLYVRGSLGESLGFVFFPLLFLFGQRALKLKKPLDGGAFIILLATLVLTHNVFAVLFAPVLLGFLLLISLQEKKQRFKNIIHLGILFVGGFLLSATFWLPALVEQHYTVLNKGILTGLLDRFATLSSLFRLTDNRSVFSLQIGIIHILGFLLGLFVVMQKKELRDIRPTFLFFAASIIVMIFLMLPLSLWFWNVMPVFKSVDFTWRYLGPLAFILSLSVGVLGKYSHKLFGVIGIIMVISINSLLIQPRGRFDKPDAFYETNDATTTAFDELMPIWVSEKARTAVEQKVVVPPELGSVTIHENRSNKLVFTANLSTEMPVIINTLYFPGWWATVNSVAMQPTVSGQQGVMELLLPLGTSNVSLEFTSTPIRVVADGISFATLIIMICYGYWSSRV